MDVNRDEIKLNVNGSLLKPRDEFWGVHYGVLCFYVCFKFSIMDVIIKIMLF